MATGAYNDDSAMPGRDRITSLDAAIREYVEPGQHLHFASTPSRSNAAIRELGRQYRNAGPSFTFSTTGMHSVAHLLGLLNLGRRYISCFFGDNYPIPRPNALYQRLLDAGADLEQWSLGSYVAAFRAGARSEPYAITTSLRGTDLAADLARKGVYLEVPDPAEPDRPLSLIKAMRADVVFLHAAVGDEDGNALFCPPLCEGFHAALGARRGTIVTVEQIVPRGELTKYPQFLPLPSHRVLAICQAPKGAHPQPLHIMPEVYRPLAYGDDTVQYEFWRHLTRDNDLFERFCDVVLAPREDESAYSDFVRRWACTRQSSTKPTGVKMNLAKQLDGPVELTRTAGILEPYRQDTGWLCLSEDAWTTLLAARAICRRVISENLSTILAGIGQSFAAARVAKVLLTRQGYAPELVVETGLSDFDPVTADAFLLGYRNILSSKRVTDVDHVLGSLVCGTGSRSLGVIGAAQIDGQGRINSTRVAGKFLVGSGGANDIASSANEVLVVTRALPDRLPATVEYITSPGARVRSIVTERWELHRVDATRPWRVMQWIGAPPDVQQPSDLPNWNIDASCTGPSAAPPTAEEIEAIGMLLGNTTGNEKGHARDAHPARSVS